ncbi:MAG: hypothetical protein ACRD4Q_07745 [Candidatus Acidiferrales bacterium]
MSAYGFVLFIHFCALIAAFAASALTHFAESRMSAAPTVADVRNWAGLTERVAMAFPIAIVVLVGSGIYMVQAAWPWNAGWIDASLAGVFVLVINGPLIIGSRHRWIMRSLAVTGDGPVNPELARLVRDPLMRSASWANTILALGIVLVMVIKPSLAASIAILVVALIVGAAIAMPMRRPSNVAADTVVSD